MSGPGEFSGDYAYNLHQRGVQFGDTQGKKRSSDSHPCPYDPEINELCWDPYKPKGSLPPDNGCLLRWTGKVWEEIWCRQSAEDINMRFVVFSNPPRQVTFDPDTGDPIPTDTITVQLRIIGDFSGTPEIETDYEINADEDTEVFLYTSSPDGHFEVFDPDLAAWVTVTSVVITADSSTADCRYVDTTGGNPVIECSLVELA